MRFDDWVKEYDVKCEWTFGRVDKMKWPEGKIQPPLHLTANIESRGRESRFGYTMGAGIASRLKGVHPRYEQKKTGGYVDTWEIKSDGSRWSSRVWERPTGAPDWTVCRRLFEGPDLRDLFESLASDVRCVSDGETFEDFCQCFGYDEDSREAERIYNACRDVLDKLLKLFGFSGVVQLLEIDFEEDDDLAA